MKKLRVIDADRMKLILRAFASLDDARWAASPNYNLINYSHPDLTADEKLLAHWLCYIMDRKMPFRRIWELGGYVLSHLVRTFTRSDQPPEAVMAKYITGIGTTNLALECPLESTNARLALYGQPFQGDTLLYPQCVLSSYLV